MTIDPYVFLVIFLVVAVVFPLLPIGLSALFARVFSPAKPGAEKNASYECGVESKGTAHVRFKSQYYIYGIVFLIFDVESAFLLPMAVAFGGMTWWEVVVAMVFVLLLVEGLVWAWSKGVLVWK